MAKQTAYIDVNGMTCQSCVQLIEGALGEEAGVVSVKVSLEQKEAVVEYVASEISAHKLVDEINSLNPSKFTAKLRNSDNAEQPIASQQEKAAPPAAVAVSKHCTVLHIDNMTCMSCVANIERKLSKKTAGVLAAKVLLEEKTGTIEYDEAVTTPVALLDVVNNIGKFVAYIKSVDDKQVETATVDIKGMSCNGCVKNIQGKMSDKPGILSILVSLEQNNARVVFDPTVTGVDQICQHINDIAEKFTATPSA